jgi:hypothetical protein
MESMLWEKGAPAAAIVVWGGGGCFWPNFWSSEGPPMQAAREIHHATILRNSLEGHITAMIRCVSGLAMEASMLIALICMTPERWYTFCPITRMK